jgi:hypothetical protein
MVTDYTRPKWLGEPEYRPSELWERQVAAQAPYWETRAPMRQLGQRLQARYALGAPQFYGSELHQGSTIPADEPTFADYIGGYTGGVAGDWEADTYQKLLARAQAAGAATRQPLGEYLSGVTPGSPSYLERAWYAGEFGPGESGYIGAEQERNQLAAATLLALQRRGGGLPYTGAMGRAIANAVEAQQQHRENIGQPGGSFLDWYTSQLPAA